jgi:hypothetical protein
MFGTFLFIMTCMFIVFVGTNQVANVTISYKYNDEPADQPDDLAKYDPYHSSRALDVHNEFQNLAIANIKNQANMSDFYNADINDNQRVGSEGSRVPSPGGKAQKTIYGDAYPQFRYPILHKNWVPFFKNIEDPYVFSQRNKGFEGVKPPGPKWTIS